MYRYNTGIPMDQHEPLYNLEPLHAQLSRQQQQQLMEIHNDQISTNRVAFKVHTELNADVVVGPLYKSNPVDP